MPYYIGDVIKDVKRLIARTPEKFMETGVNVRLNTKVEEISGEHRTVRLADGTTLPYDVLVLGTGTTTVVPEMQGVDLPGVFTLKKLSDAIRMKAYITEHPCRKAVIVGAGFIGMEMCEALSIRKIDTSVIHRGSLPVNRWDPEFSKEILDEMTHNGVRFFPNTGITSIEEGKDYRLRLNTNQGAMDADLILIAIGIKPNAALAGDMGLQIGKTGAIQVDFSQRTSGDGVYAVGDCCEVFHRVSKKWTHIPLGDIANKQGRIAGHNIGGGSIIFPGVVGAQAFKIFNLEVAATGLDESEAMSSGYHPVSAIVWGDAIGRSMPGDKRLGIKLVADRSTGKLLGAQSIGAIGAVGRINALSTALWTELNIHEVAYLDFAYAPPVSAAWDPIHIAAQQLSRKL